MNVLDIIVNYLKENNYDGLYYENECSCLLDDICPCGELSLNCQPGYKLYDNNGNWYVGNNETS